MELTEDEAKLAEGAQAGMEPDGGEKTEDYKRLYFEMKKTAEEYLTRLKYLQADFENFKKRAAKERMETVLFANEELMGEMLPILDEIEAARQKMKEGEDREGVRMIHTNFLKALKQNGLAELKILEDEVLDPDLHEAVEEEKSEDPKLAGKVAKVLQKGYLLNGKVLRFAKVRVYVKADEKTD